MAEQFNVDLRGIVDILSHHLYSSERVYLRELIQNGRDAIATRVAQLGPYEGRVTISPSRGIEPMIVRDNGIGLTAEEMRTLLATIGGSSKREDFAAARSKFLGQFGIGLLSCFLVADSIEVYSRSARTPYSATIRWIGHADGTFTIEEADLQLDQPGTEIHIRPRHGDASWCQEETVRALVSEYCEFLDVPVFFENDLLSQHTPPWELSLDGQLEWCREQFGFEPMGIISLDAAMVGARGLGFVLPYSAQPGHRTGDRIYARGLLVAQSETQLVPDWAFFCRAVVDAGELPLTASRESLQESAALRIIREQLGRRLLGELIKVHGMDPEVYEDVVRLHANGLKSLAVSEPDLRQLIISTMPFDTTEGIKTLEDLDGHSEVAFIADTEKYDALADIATQTGFLVINASGQYDAELLRRMNGLDGGTRYREVDVDAVLSMIQPTAHDDQESVVRMVQRASRVLEPFGTEVRVRSFLPEARPALWWPTYTSLEDGRSGDAGTRPTLVLNASNDVVGRLLDGAVPDDMVEDVVRAVYVVGLLQARASLTVQQSAALADTLLHLVAFTSRVAR